MRASGIAHSQQVTFIQDSFQPLSTGALYSLALFAVPIVSTLCLHTYFYRVYKTSVHVRHYTVDRSEWR